ncbi:hypothetical protein SAMN02910447_00458 [Ruminococcus sp. YE71]|uniref:hypothetical protein n=1 Tax=unclassified Ruminococcus TaxID=2608920 RepID=UPI00088988C9|nr:MULTISPECIES: hypothetical protein [unclassified Ruminococcus]SDA11683.1 hypothetical protein SAMN02910446_00457 [Ruminococcus sp. YE78]SFW15620.1 hypothetical protein SAMN02910447_00458 [Ruminococcus sp. YE71]
MNIGEKDMELINRLARRELKEDEVYVFPVKLCDNRTDRDGERFSIGALEKLAELFVGKTGIFDHDPKGANQTARIYAAEVVREPERRTGAGEVYTAVTAKAYMMRTDSNADLIKEIDGGIKKEVSVSCAVKRRVCSLCGADMKHKPCSHVKGMYYGGKRCEVILDGVTDAYEWSFVAVPAQPEAGITKSLSEEREGDTVKALRAELAETSADVSLARRDIIAEIVRLGHFCVPAYSDETVKRLCMTMSVGELLSFKEETRKNADVGELKGMLLKDEDESGKKPDGRFRLRK